ncbi:MAG: ATP-binding protein [Bdellovibrionia bacterium]
MRLSDRKVGTGLGLFIVKGIIDAHGGKVWVKSALHVGSEFYFTLRYADRVDQK